MEVLAVSMVMPVACGALDVANPAPLSSDGQTFGPIGIVSYFALIVEDHDRPLSAEKTGHLGMPG